MTAFILGLIGFIFALVIADNHPKFLQLCSGLSTVMFIVGYFNQNIEVINTLWPMGLMFIVVQLILNWFGDVE